MIKTIIAILNRLACRHKWAMIHEVFFYTKQGIQEDMPTGSTRLYCCGECGKFKKIKL